MKQSLDGARFRWINEKLYKSDSTHAHAMMREDPAVFNDYHKGFRRQVSSWPSNPVSHYISVLSSYPEHTVIADLGCGDAALARALIPRGFNVMSFDLVSDRAFVIEADIFERLPLPGSDEDCDDGEESGQGHAQIVNVVVCALSLMGTNWPNCIREAWRILRPDGELKIAEVASRLTNVRQFQSFIESFGFRHQSTDDSNTHFTLFEFKKTSRNSRGEKEWSKLLTRGDMLKPCEYKRR
ncbi:methyltransferase-domain-containing protein [Lactifluus volemus]|nr:methyltransferase-domain-containing protein [Lactifluus volemus]